jgi:exopolysaccharide biosynthesis polyprenyl glycosylphosphotransferase
VEQNDSKRAACGHFMITRRSELGLRLGYVVSDVLAIIAAYLATLFFRFHSDLGQKTFDFVNPLLGVRESGLLDDSFLEFYTHSAPRIIFFLAVVLVALYAFFNQYAGRRFLLPRGAAWNVIRANLIALLLFFGYFYLRHNIFHPRSMFLMILTLNTFFCLWFRGVTARLLRRLHARWRWLDCPTAVFGESREADYIRALIDAEAPHGLRVVAQLPWQPATPWSTVADGLEKAVREHNLRLLIYADKRMDIPEIMRLLELTEKLGVAVKILSEKMTVLYMPGRQPVDFILEMPLVHFAAPPATAAGDYARHLLANISAATTLILAAPFMALIALAIRLSSKGPVLFIQERIGINRRAFQMLKFRTMHNRAEELQAAVEEFNESGAGLFKIRRDPRVTATGRFLRRFSLDELPQLINVLRGEMTLVGPRPLPRRDFENYYEEWHYSRHGGLPGLTCLWQVSGRSDIDFHNMCILDVYYLRNRSLLLDLKILLRTINVVLFAKGAY